MRPIDPDLNSDNDNILFDWEFAGYGATPGIDLAYLALHASDYGSLSDYQLPLLWNYYLELINSGKV